MKKLFIAVAVLLAAVSCRKEEFVAPAEGTTVLEVSLDKTVKTGLAPADENKSRKIYWLKGDQLAWDGVASVALGEEFTAGAAKTSATFTWNDELDYPCNLLYPASIWKDDTHITLPAVQAASGKSDTIASDVLPMYAHIALGEGAPALKSLLGLVKITWTLAADDPDSHKIKVIEFSGKADEQVSGEFEIDYSTGVLTPASSPSDADKKVTVTVGKTATTDTPYSCLVAVPAGTYSAGFTVKLIDQYGHYMEKSKPSSFIVTAGNVSVLPSFEFVPSGTQITVITTADEWNAYADAYNSGNYTDAEIAADLDFTGKPLTNITGSFRNVIDGQNKSIGGLVDCSISLVETVEAEGVVKNVVIAESCNYIVTGFNDGEIFYCAPLVKILKGTVDNCVNNATISFAAYTGNLPFGGYVGGLVANAGSSSKAKILNCTNNGSITVPETFADGSNPGISTNRIAIGGIAGYGSATEVSNCSNTADITINYPLGGCIVGGISGGVTANYSECSNSGNITKINGTGQRGRNEYLAGINAYTWTDGVKYHDCSNTGDISTSGAFQTRYVGGITAYNTKSIDFARCSNSGNLTVSGAKVYYSFVTIGGLIAYSKYKQTLDLSGCSVSGEISLGYDSVANKAAADKVAIGGLVGLCGEGVTIKGNNFSFNPNIHVNFNKLGRDTANDDDYVGIGGLVGVNKVVNKGVSGPVTIDGCTVGAAGIILIDDNNGSKNKFVVNNVGVGGILGESLVDGVSISDCAVKGTVGISPTARNDGSSTDGSYSVGGIAGEIKGDDSEITSCDFLDGAKLYANVYNSSDETLETGVFAGGILGRFVNEDKSLSISGCEVAISKAKVDRAITGGIAGKVVNAKISGCSFNSTAVFSSAKSSAGIVGFIKDGTVENCTVKATGSNAIYCNYTTSSHEFAGGIAAVANNTDFTNCKSFANIFANKGCNSSNPRFSAAAVGGFVAKAENGCAFENCSCGGTIGDTVDSKNGLPGVISGELTAQTIHLSTDNVNIYAVMAGDEAEPFDSGTTTFTYWDGN